MERRLCFRDCVSLCRQQGYTQWVWLLGAEEPREIADSRDYRRIAAIAVPWSDFSFAEGEQCAKLAFTRAKQRCRCARHSSWEREVQFLPARSKILREISIFVMTAQIPHNFQPFHEAR